jgi:hypothetical protein
MFTGRRSPRQEHPAPTLSRPLPALSWTLTRQSPGPAAADLRRISFPPFRRTPSSPPSQPPQPRLPPPTMASAFLRGKQTGMQNDLSAAVVPELFAPDDQARYGINSQIRSARRASPAKNSSTVLTAPPTAASPTNPFSPFSPSARTSRSLVRGRSSSSATPESTRSSRPNAAPRSRPSASLPTSSSPSTTRMS